MPKSLGDIIVEIQQGRGKRILFSDEALLNIYSGHLGEPGQPGQPGEPGPPGPMGESNGEPGEDGLSAYEIALLDGFVGTQAAWVDSLVGPAGATGSTGSQGSTGANGAQGSTGAQGTPGDTGPTGADGAAGAVGSQGIQGIQGVPGASGTWGAITGTLGDQTDLGSALALKAPIASPTFTGTVAGVTKAMVGLTNADNTADSAKPVSSATQTALDLKAPLASPTFTGTVAGVTKTHVGLANVDNTTDAGKPVSSAGQTALNLKANLAAPSFTGNITISANNIVTDTTTGMQVATGATQKLGFFGVTPVVRPTAITQTYSTATATHAAVTQLAAPAGGTGATAGAYSTAANRDLMIASINAARTDIANVKQVLNTVIDQLQALGLLQ